MTPRPSSRVGPAIGLGHNTLWIFGYGSLCWKPDFEYVNKTIGYVRGYSRKFWQGNTAHRGTPGKPGRVATLIEETDSEVWGVGYEVLRNSPVLNYLWERECLLGGYHLIKVTFYPVGKEPVEGLAYLATPASPGWLGEASVGEIALQVADAKGPAGPNCEYICRLASWIRNNTPAKDHHLELLDLLVKTALFHSTDQLLAEESISEIIKNYPNNKGCIKQYEFSLARTQA